MFDLPGPICLKKSGINSPDKEAKRAEHHSKIVARRDIKQWQDCTKSNAIISSRPRHEKSALHFKIGFCQSMTPNRFIERLGFLLSIKKTLEIVNGNPKKDPLGGNATHSGEVVEIVSPPPRNEFVVIP